MNNSYHFSKKLLLEFFLEADAVTTLNRVAVATASVCEEQVEIISALDTFQRREIQDLAPCKYRGFGWKNLFYENVILNMPTETYKEHFNMKRSTAEILVDHITHNLRPSVSKSSLVKKLHVFLYLLTSGCSYSAAGLLFGLHKSSVCYIIHEISSLLSQLQSQFIKWPSTEEQHLTRMKVSGKFGFPNCIGFIDSCRFRLASKKCNIKTKHQTVLLQGVCDESLKFIDIFVGSIGETRKFRIYKESPLSQKLEHLVEFENHVLGDSNYKLKRNLMIPFKEVLTSEEANYNDTHWKTRAFIGCAFGRLQSKFKKLNHLDMAEPENITSILTAACVLHNFILKYEPDAETVKLEISYDKGVLIDTDIVKKASEKRQFLCNYLNYFKVT